MEPVADESLLDVGCGPGATALAFAPHVERVVGVDLAPSMLKAARLAARRAGIDHLACAIADAHRLPFHDRAFQLVTCRATAHHFHDIGGAIGEMARVLGRGGRLGIADGTVPADPEIDAFINALDTLHDPTTIRNYSAAEWRRIAQESGLRLDWVEDETYDLAEGRMLSDWLARSGASSDVLTEARRRLLEASPKIRDYLRVRPENGDVRFDLPKIVLTATRVD
jgi:SAM-dependent methyltransferase